MADNELSESELKDLVNSLTSKYCQVLQSSLSKLHMHLVDNHLSKIDQFYKIGGFTNILQLLSRPNAEWVEKAIDILTRCCRLHQKYKIISTTETIPLITSLFKFYYKNEKIQVSLCETISRLYFREEARMMFHNLGINSAIIDLLLYRQLSLSDYGEVYLTLVFLNKTPQIAKETIQILLTKCNPTDNDLMIKIISMIAGLMNKPCTKIVAQQIRTTIGISNLVNYAQSSDHHARFASVRILTKISDKSNEICREIGEAGMIPFYIHTYETYGLCQLLRHVDNRNRIFQIVNGFETLISLLHHWDVLNRRNQKSIINAIEQFFFEDEEYNESHIVKFLNLDLVSILVTVLDNCVKNTNTARYIGQILQILTVISSNHEFHFRFLNSTILDVLLRAWLSESHDQQLMRIENIVMPLLRGDVCLQFPQMMRKIMDEYGLENINRLLTTGSESVKRAVALILPYILFTEVGVSGVYNLALELFLKNLADPSNDYFQESLNTFFQICEEGQSSDIDSFSHESHERDYCVLYSKEFDLDVNFILDDGETVSANRSILIQSSDMFDAMLNGLFMEASQSEIRFKCASTEMFEFILHLLHGCSDSGETSCPVLRNAQKYEFLFEASDMADRMLLMNLKGFIFGIIAKKLTRYSAVSVCRYAQQNNYTTFLCLLVDHFVKSSVGKNFKTDLFTIILSSELNEHLINEIKLKIESLHFL